MDVCACVCVIAGMPDVSTLPALDVSDKIVLDLYRSFYKSLSKGSTISLAAKAVWVRMGKPDDPGSTTIRDKISGLCDILPVYVEALVGLCNERKDTSVTPLAWWHSYTTRAQPTLFDSLYARLPTASLDLKRYDLTHYQMANQAWMRRASIHVFKTDRLIAELMAHQGDSADACEAMLQDIKCQYAEVDRRDCVYSEVAQHRLRSEDIPIEYSEREIKELFSDAQEFSEHLCDLPDVLRANQFLDDAYPRPSDSPKPHETALYHLAKRNCEATRQLTHKVEFLLERVFVCVCVCVCVCHRVHIMLLVALCLHYVHIS
jgi:hypothetical protein